MSTINFDDLVGFPQPGEDGQSVRYLRTPLDAWDAEVLFVDDEGTKHMRVHQTDYCRHMVERYLEVKREIQNRKIAKIFRDSALYRAMSPRKKTASGQSCLAWAEGMAEWIPKRRAS